jgi:hypothetical protein
MPSPRSLAYRYSSSRPCTGQCQAAAARLACDLHARGLALDERAHAGEDGALIVDEQDCDREGKRGAGIVFEHNPLNPLTRHAASTCPFDANAVLIGARTMHARLRAAGFGRISLAYRASCKTRGARLQANTKFCIVSA